MILYFSATGNSKYVAERIAAETEDSAVSLTEIKEPVIIDKGKQLGIITPTYSWEVPIVVRDFLEKSDIRVSEDSFVYIISTYGTTPGASGADAKHLLNKKGIEADALYSVKMPDTWTPIFDLSNKEKVERTNIKAEDEINEVIRKIKGREKGNFQKLRMPYPIRLISDKMYQEMRKTSHLHVEDTCISCGLCAGKCPVKAIEMIDGHPVWVKDKCAMCLGCLHRCPVFAIQYGNNTKMHGQYKHPKTRV